MAYKATSVKRLKMLKRQKEVDTDHGRSWPGAGAVTSKFDRYWAQEKSGDRRIADGSYIRN